jgi:hypothetical protein
VIKQPSILEMHGRNGAIFEVDLLRFYKWKNLSLFFIVKMTLNDCSLEEKLLCELFLFDGFPLIQLTLKQFSSL